MWGLAVYEPSPFDTHPTNTRATYVLKSKKKGPYVLKIPYVLLANECISDLATCSTSCRRFFGIHFRCVDFFKISYSGRKIPTLTSAI